MLFAVSHLVPEAPWTLLQPLGPSQRANARGSGLLERVFSPQATFKYQGEGCLNSLRFRGFTHRPYRQPPSPAPPQAGDHVAIIQMSGPGLAGVQGFLPGILAWGGGSHFAVPSPPSPGEGLREPRDLGGA